MSLIRPARPRSRRLVAGLAAVALTVLALAAPADALKPDGSRATVMLETGDVSLNPANAITSGWWGHEGGLHNGTGTGSTFLSMDGSDGAGTVNDASIAAMVAAMGATDISQIRYAIVPTSADGSNEKPTVTGTQNAATVFANGWLLNDGGVGVGLNGNTLSNDSVTIVSTPAEINDWITAGEPAQDFDSQLKLHDTNDPGHVLSLHPKGKSILNAWAAGTNLSLVAYVSSGDDPTRDNKIPLVAADGTGHAKTAWLPFTTVAKPGDAVRTSAGYQVAGAYAPTVSTAASWTTGKLTATVKNKSNATATDATGTIEFAEVVNGTRQAPTSVATVNGVASFTLPSFTTTKVYDARYVPDVAASTSYLTSDWKRTTLTASKVSLSVVGGSTSDTLTATASPVTAGTVRFYDGTTLLKSMSVSTSTGKAVYKKLLSAKKHTLKVTFTPTSSLIKPSSYTKVVYKPTISITKSPSTVKHGTYPKLTVKVVATGTTVSGTIVITYDPASGSTKTITATLSGGAKTVTLPKAVAGTTKITVTYKGHSPVLAATKTYSYKVS